MSYSEVFVSSIDEVRHRIGDTDEENPQLTTEEIAFELGRANGNTNQAVLGCIKSLMARYASMADTTELDLSVRASQLYDHYKDLLVTFSNSFLGGTTPVPYAGGISRADGLVNDSNTDRIRGIFDRSAPYPRWGGVV